MPVLLIEVHLVEPLWHGTKDWPPSPFRLFQALVSGAYGGRWAGESEEAKQERMEAFRWLERQDPPFVAFPARHRGRAVTSFVPNNDLDSVGGDPSRVADIRVEKTLVTWRIENNRSFVYAWRFDQGAEHASKICTLALRLHRFGRGVDGAWACAKVFADGDAEKLLQNCGTVSRPRGRSDLGLRCPVSGSLDSLIRRHEAATFRFKWDSGSGKFLFRQPPKPTYRAISYDSPATCLYFEIRQQADVNRFYPVPQTSVVSLAEEARESAARRLVAAMPEWGALAEKFLTGRSAGPDDLNRRIRIVPLPSIGHQQTSPAIRRIAVLVPSDCPIAAADLGWAFNGQTICGSRTGELANAPAILIQVPTSEMTRHYGFDRPAKQWRSVTPVALPRPVPHTRSGSERAASEARGAAAVAQACRHAGVAPSPMAIRVQAEPFLLRGEPAPRYATERFRGRLRHVEITFNESISGPLILGDGRFAGLGLMHPVFEKGPGLHVFAVENAVGSADTAAVLRALRRALMARAQYVIGPNRTLPMIFHGHDASGAPARNGHHSHLFFAAYSSEGLTQANRLAIMAPDLCDRNARTTSSWDVLARAVDDLRFLVCGSRGEFRLTAVSPEKAPIFGVFRNWRSVTPYRTTRHPKRGESIPEFIAADFRTECARRAIPVPQSLVVIDIHKGLRNSLSAELELTFKAAVCGPLLLGQGSHFGDGLFTGG